MTDFKKELEVEIRIDGTPLQGISKTIIKDGKVDYSLAEQHFYDILRKWEDNWIKESFEEEKESIISNLTPKQEEILTDKHAEDYNGLDDDMPDDYENWLMELDLDDLKKYLANEEDFAVKSSEATEEEINESNRLVANDRTDE